MKKINLRESLLKIDRSTDFKHALTDLYEACMLEDSDKKKLAQFIEDKDIPGMSAMLSNKAGIMSENVSDDLPDDEVPLVEGGELSLHGVANLEDIDYIMSYEMANCVVYEGDTSGEYKCAYHNGASVEVKFNPEAPGYVYTIDGEGPYETNSSETVQSDIIHALDRKCWKEAFPEGAPVDEGWNPNLTDCPCCGDISFDSIRGRCTQCSYVEDLTEGIFSIAGDAVGKGLGDLYKGVKNVAKGVRDVAVAGANDAKKAVTDIKQSKFADKVRDASRAIKNADTVDDFKSDYKRRQEMRQKSDTKRDQVWKDKRGNERIGKSIGNEQDWIYVVNGKKMNYDEYKKIPSAERSRLNNEGKVQKLDLSGKQITKSQNKKRLNAKVKESLLLEGPGAGYEIACNITIENFLGATTIKRIEVDRDPGAFPGSYKVYLSCDATGSADDIEANSYYYGDTFEGRYPVKISEILMSVSVVGEGDIRDAVEECLDDILSDLVGNTFTSKYVYGGGWSHSTYDGTLTDTTNPLNDTCWGEDDIVSYEVYAMDARLIDSDIIDDIDCAVTGENESEDDLDEAYTHFTYKSGSNPYIAKTENEKNRILKKYGDKAKEVRPGFYEIDDTSDNSDSFKFDSLTESAGGRFNLEVWVPGSGGDDRERPLISSNNMQEIIDVAYATELDSDEAFYLSDMRGIYPYDLDQCYDAEELENAIYNEWHYTPAGDMRKTLGKMLLPQNEGVESSKEWEHKDKDGKIGRIRQSDGRGDRKFLTRDQAKEIAKFRGHEDDELYPVNESESIKEASYGFKNGNRYYGGLPNDEDIFDSPQVYYPKEETKIADNNDPIAVRKLRQNIANPLYKLILDEVAPENQFDGDQVYVTTYPNSEEIYLVSEVLLDNDCPDKSTAMSNMKNYLNRIGISFNPQLIEVDIDSFDDGETYVYTAFPLSALSMKSNEALNKDLDESKSINKIGDTSLTERVGPTHPEESKIADRLMSIPGTTKVEFDWSNAEVYRVPENHLIMLVFCRDGFDEPYFENRRKWRASVLGKLRTMGWTLEDPVEDNDSYLYLVMRKRVSVTENVDTPKSGLTKYKVTWKIINADDSYVKESKEVFAKDEKSATATVKDKRARDIKAVKMTEAFKHPQRMTESTANNSKLIRNAITELVKRGSSISDTDFVDVVMDYMEDAFGEHPSYREVLNAIRDFRSKERTNTLKSVDTSSRNTFQVGDEMTYSGLYGGETTIKVLGVNGSRMKAEISWSSMEDGSDLKDKKVFDIVLDDEGNDCIEVWHYRGETGRVYPPKRGSGLEESFSTGDRVKQKFANPYNVGKIIGKKKTPKDGEMVRVKWDYSDGDDVEWVNVDDVSPYNEDDEKAGCYESLFKLREDTSNDFTPDENGFIRFEVVPDTGKWQYSVGGKDVPYTSYEDAVAHIKDDYNICDYRQELQQYLKSNGFDYFVDETFDGRLCIEIHRGDWKHEHRRADYLVRHFFMDKGLGVHVDEQVTEDGGSDCYSAEHYYSINDLYFRGRVVK